MGELFEKLILGWFVLSAIQSIYRALRGGEEASEEFAGSPAMEGLPNETFDFMIEESMAQLVQASADVETLAKRVTPLIRSKFPQGQVYDLLRTHLRVKVRTELDNVRAALDGAHEILETNGELAAVSYLNRSDVIANSFKTLAELWNTVGTIEGLLMHRQTRETRELLGMAEAIGGDLVQSWSAHVGSTYTRTEPPAVVALIAQDGAVDLPAGVLPNQLLVTVSVDALAEPHSWLAVVHSTARAFLEHHRDVFSQLSGGLGETNTPWLPRRQGRNIVVDTRSMFGAWRATIIADTLGTLSLGPAYVHGLYRVLENPDDPSSVMDAPASGDGQTFGPRPPSHLRIMLCCEVLQDLGFAHTASEIRRAWFLGHGESDGMWAETMWGQYLQVPWDQLFTIGGEMVRHTVNAPIPSLNRQSLRELNGVSMTPERWHTVDALLSSWLTNEDGNGSPLTGLAAFLMGQVEHESRQTQLFSRMRRMLLNQHTPRSRSQSPTVSATNVRRPLTRLECLEAMILRNILVPKYQRGHKNPQQRI